MKSVYTAVRTGSLNKAVCASYLKGLYCTYLVLVSYLFVLSNDHLMSHLSSITLPGLTDIPEQSSTVNGWTIVYSHKTSWKIKQLRRHSRRITPTSAATRRNVS